MLRSCSYLVLAMEKAWITKLMCVSHAGKYNLSDKCILSTIMLDFFNTALFLSLLLCI